MLVLEWSHEYFMLGTADSSKVYHIKRAAELAGHNNSAEPDRVRRAAGSKAAKVGKLAAYPFKTTPDTSTVSYLPRKKTGPGLGDITIIPTVEIPYSATQRLRLRGVHKVELSYLVVTSLLERQNGRLKLVEEDAWPCRAWHVMVVCLLGVEPVADARLCTSGAAHALSGRGLRDQLHPEAVLFCARVEEHLLGEASINDIDDAIDRQTCLGNICRHDAFSPGRPLVDPLL